jgi:hypothetical protein
MRQHSGGVVSNQSVDTDRSRTLDPRRIVDCPDGDGEACIFRFLHEGPARDPVVQRDS